jgi:hypothetical protein
VTKTPENVPKALDAIADVVFAYQLICNLEPKEKTREASDQNWEN